VLAVLVGVQALDVSWGIKNKETLRSKSDRPARDATELSRDRAGTTIVTKEKLFEGEPVYPGVTTKKQAKTVRCGDIQQKQSLGEP
jgi:hypothetical protein